MYNVWSNPYGVTSVVIEQKIKNKKRERERKCLTEPQCGELMYSGMLANYAQCTYYIPGKEREKGKEKKNKKNVHQKQREKETRRQERGGIWGKKVWRLAFCNCLQSPVGRERTTFSLQGGGSAFAFSTTKTTHKQTREHF